MAHAVSMQHNNYPSAASTAQSFLARERSGPAFRPVDMVHLAKQSLGDRLLEQEILELFRSQSKLYLERLENAASAEDRRLASHTILGSARSIGAWEVAREAEAIQIDASKRSDLIKLTNAIEAANAYIGSILDN